MSHLFPLCELLEFLNAFVYCMSTTNTRGISASGQEAQKLRQQNKDLEWKRLKHTSMHTLSDTHRDTRFPISAYYLLKSVQTIYKHKHCHKYTQRTCLFSLALQVYLLNSQINIHSIPAD